MADSLADRKRRLIAAVDRLAPDWVALARTIHDHPELAGQETQACRWLSDALRRAGFDVTCGAAGMPTAFVAAKDTCDSGPLLAYVAEYDALPDVGHACGHDLSGAASCLAAVALAESEGASGVRLRVMGTPGEEKEEVGGKIGMLEAGLFDGVDVAMMAHAGFVNLPNRDMMVRKNIQIEFRAAADNAAASKGADSGTLDAVLQTFDALASLRGQLPPRGQVRGVIAEAGRMIKNRPDYSCARAEVVMRATQVEQLDELERRLRECAQAAADQAGAVLDWSSSLGRYLPPRRNGALEDAYAANLRLLGLEVHEFPADESYGSTDFGNVSRTVPGVHAYFKMVERGTEHHTAAFAAAATSETAALAMVQAAKTLALTGLDVMADDGLLARIRADFQSAAT